MSGDPGVYEYKQQLPEMPQELGAARQAYLNTVKSRAFTDEPRYKGTLGGNLDYLNSLAKTGAESADWQPSIYNKAATGLESIMGADPANLDPYVAQRYQNMKTQLQPQLADILQSNITRGTLRGTGGARAVAEAGGRALSSFNTDIAQKTLENFQMTQANRLGAAQAGAGLGSAIQTGRAGMIGAGTGAAAAASTQHQKNQIAEYQDWLRTLPSANPYNQMLGSYAMSYPFQGAAPTIQEPAGLISSLLGWLI